MKAKLSWLTATLFSLFFLTTAVSISTRRLLWFDEINTLGIAKLPDLATVWQVQNSFRADSPPIVYHLLVRLFYTLSGHAENSARLLAALAMTAAMLVIFDCARRLTDGMGGLIALCVLGCSLLPQFGYDGRPYTLVVLFTSIALWLWLHTGEDNKTAAAAFGFAIFMAVEMHFNTVLAMLPFGAWELYHWRPWRRPSWKLMAGAAGILCAFAVSFSQMKHAAQWSASNWAKPSLAAMEAVLGHMFPSGLLTLAALVLLMCVFRRFPVSPMSDAEQLCWFFLAIPFAGFLLAEAVTKAFHQRYLIATLPGVAVAAACLASRRLTRLAAVGFLLLLCVLMTWRQTVAWRKAEEIEPAFTADQSRTRFGMSREDRVVADGKRIVIANFDLLGEMQYYSKRPDLYAMYQPDDSGLECRYFGSACLGMDAVKSRANEVAALYPSDKLIEDMREAGFRATMQEGHAALVYFSPK